MPTLVDTSERRPSLARRRYRLHPAWEGLMEIALGCRQAVRLWRKDSCEFEWVTVTIVPLPSR